MVHSAVVLSSKARDTGLIDYLARIIMTNLDTLKMSNDRNANQVTAGVPRIQVKAIKLVRINPQSETNLVSETGSQFL